MEGTNGLLIGPGYDEETVLNTLRKVAARPGIATLSATREGRVHGLSHQLLNSPLDILTVETLARWIRPDLFADVDPTETLRRINEDFLAIPLTGINWIDLPFAD
jgi:iron complex transport system substrate-binding protein